MKPKSFRYRIDVNVEELDRILDEATQTPMTKPDCQKVKAAVHAMAERLRPKRSTEKTSTVIDRPAASPGALQKQNTGDSAPSGHGRNSAAVFTSANRVTVVHSTLHSGDICPECCEGKVYRQKQPATLVRVIGQAPLAATVFEMERLRCNACGEIFTADEPQEAGPEKYDAGRQRWSPF
jgi:hypothetical protein